MTILLIGSEGFIGSHCMAFFRLHGHEVMCCDVEERQEDNYISKSTLGSEYSMLFEGRKIDICINAAGSANVAYSYEFPERDFELNVALVINLLGAIKNHAPECKFINLSSAAVYGNPKTLPIREMDDLKPLSPYGYHKMLSEKLLSEYSYFFGLRTCSLRVFSAYGPGLKKHLFWDLYQKSKNSSVIRLFGTGNESRDFIYIDDLVSAIDLLIKFGNFRGETINVASGNESLISEAASIFANGFDHIERVDFTGESKMGDPVNWKADISKLRELQFKPRITLKEGVENYIQWLTNLGREL